MICGRTDRYYLEKGWWRRWCWKESGHPGDCHELINPTVAVYGLAAQLKAKADDAAEVVEPFTVVEPGHPVDVATLPSSAKSLANWVSANPGWRVAAQQSVTRHEPVFYVADGKTARKGDVKTPARDVTHTWVRGVMAGNRQKVAEFTAEWLSIDNKNKFDGALTWDMFTLATLPETTTGEFHEWLRTLAPKGAPKQRAIKKTSVEKTADQNEALINGEEWSAA